MKIIAGLLVIAALGGAWAACPKGVKDAASQALQPAPETMAEMRAGIDALLEHWRGPGDLNPERDVLI